MPPITTHVLDTSSGSPASNMKIIIFKNIEIDQTLDSNSNSNSNTWEQIGSTITNDDGR